MPCLRTVPLVLMALLALGLIMGPGPAVAHDLDITGGAFGAGYVLPLRSLATVLGFVGIGLWAGLLGGAAVWQLPAIAIGGALIACLIGEAGVVLPHAELGLMIALVAIGALIVLGLRLPVLSPPVITALAAVFEGYPLAQIVQGPHLPFLAGFAVAAILALASGLGLAVLLGRTPAAIGIRALGAAIAVIGVLMLIDKI